MKVIIRMNETRTEKIGRFIKKIRKDNNLTQKELANILGVTFQAVSKWENGINIPDILMLKQISEKFNCDITELLDGEYKKEKYNYLYLIPVIIIIIIVILILVFNKSSSFEFKQISSLCNEFNITGSIAYNNDKSSMYISNIEFCGVDDNIIYSSIECNLYENYNNRNYLITSCSNVKDKTLSEFLKTLTINMNDYKSVCKQFNETKLFIEIIANDNNGKSIKYNVPLEYNSNCN